MATKLHGVSCYENAFLDEPLFVLRAHDELAPTIVRDWAKLAQQHGCNAEKLAEARECALQMEEWQKSTGNVKLPD